MQLQKKHIKHLKVVLNREEFLKLLPHKAIVAELGVDEGSFSKRILKITKPKKLHLIDLWASKRYNETKMKKVKKRFRKEIKSGKIIIHRGKSEVELRKFNNNYFDWVYIDTAHTYEQTKKELKLALLKVKRGGIIAGHDYTQGEVRNARKYGVIEAVNKFCINNKWEIIYLTHEPHRHLSFALRKIT